MRKLLLIATLALVTISVVVVVFIVMPSADEPPSPRAEHGTTTQAICGNCALKRIRVTNAWGEDGPYTHEDKFEDTALSAELSGWAAPTCEHQWFEIRRVAWHPGGHGHAHVSGDTEALRQLAEDGDCAAAIEDFADASGRKPRGVWRSLARWTQSNYPELGESVLPGSVRDDCDRADFGETAFPRCTGPADLPRGLLLHPDTLLFSKRTEQHLGRRDLPG